MRKVAIVATASGNGKTTLGRELARRLQVPFVEMDALVHGPDWVELPDDALREQMEPIVASDGWVIDGGYWGKIGDLVLRNADVIVWLDLPLHVWLPRLVRRSVRRIRGHEQLWNNNRETFRNTLFSRNSLLLYALRAHFRHRRSYPRRLGTYDVVRLRTPREVEQWLARSVTAARR